MYIARPLCNVDYAHKSKRIANSNFDPSVKGKKTKI